MGASAPEPSLREVLEDLLSNPGFRRSLNPLQIREMESLRAERDPGLLGEALFGLARRLEGSEQIGAALEIFRASVGAVRERPLQLHMENRINALLGRGPITNRLEDLARRFVSQASDPSMLLSFAVAGGLAAWVRRASLASLAMRGGGLLTRGLGARAIAGSAAYLAEVPAFVGTHRLSRGLLSSSRDDSLEPSLAQELAGAGIFLGALKFSGALSTAILGRLTRNSALQAAGTSVGSLGGVYLGHRLQEQSGLRPAQDEANRWIDSADVWLQMMVGGRLLRADPRGAVLESRLSSFLERGPTRLTTRARESSDLLTASVHRRAVAPAIEDATLMRELPAEIPGRSALETQALITRYGEAGVRRFIYDLQACARLLGCSAERLEALALHSVINDVEVLQVGWARLHYMLRHSDPEGREGHYLNWIARLGAMTIVERNKMVFLDQVFDELHRGTTLSTLERNFAKLLPENDLFSLMPKVVRRSSGEAEVLGLAQFRELQTLPLGPEAKEVLRRYLRSPNRIPPGSLAELGNFLREYPHWQGVTELALIRARRSPLARLRVDRILQEAMAPDRLFSKVYELVEDDAAIMPYFLRDQVMRGDALSTFVGQADAYLGDGRVSNHLVAFSGIWQEAVRPVRRSLRIDQTLETIDEVFPSPRPMHPEDLVLILSKWNDPISEPLWRALQDQEFQLRILDDAEFNDLARQHHGDDRAQMWSGFTVRGQGLRPRNQVVIRQVRQVSSEVFPHMVFERLVTLVHEFEHHAHPAQAESPQEVLLREEMAAHLRHLQFRSYRGFTEAVQEILHVSPLGLGIYLRDHIERAYLRQSTIVSEADRPTLPPPQPSSGGQE